MLEPMKKSGFSLWKFVGIRFVFRVLKPYMSWLQCASIFIHCWELLVDPINLENHILLLLGYFLPLFYYFLPLSCSVLLFLNSIIIFEFVDCLLTFIFCGCCLVTQSCLTLCDPMDCSPQAPLSMGFSSQEYWNGLHSFLQGIFPTQGSNMHLLHC